jgi:hypothetical protein
MLTCSTCDPDVIGEFTADGRHATFPPLPHT